MKSKTHREQTTNVATEAAIGVIQLQAQEHEGQTATSKSQEEAGRPSTAEAAWSCERLDF